MDFNNDQNQISYRQQLKARHGQKYETIQKGKPMARCMLKTINKTQI